MTTANQRDPHHEVQPNNAVIISAMRGVIAVIPAYNEERFIASVVLSTLPYAEHVIVVDDGSSDRTAQLAERAGAHVVRQPHNMGKAQALNAGFRAAEQLGFQAVVCLDGDAQHSASDIPTLVAPILRGEADVVIGSRFLEVRSQIPAWRQVGQHALTLVTNVTSGVYSTDSQSGFRAFAPGAVDKLRFQTGGLSVESEMQFLFQKSGLRVAEAPIEVHYLDGNKRNPVIHGLQVLDAMLSLVARRRPLAFFSLPGVVLGLIGFVMGIHVVLVTARGLDLPVGLTVLTALLMIVGFLMAMTGVVLHSVHKFAERLTGDMQALIELRQERAGEAPTPKAEAQRPLHTAALRPAAHEPLS